MRREVRAALVVASVLAVAGCGGGPVTHPTAAGSISSVAVPQPLGHVSNPSPDLVIPGGTDDAHLTHPANEPWSQLLAPVPSGWKVVTATAPMTIDALSAYLGKPARVKSELQFYDYERGVERGTAGGGLGVSEQLWQFDTTRNALAWYGTVVSAYEHLADVHSFTIASTGGYGFIAPALDNSANHFAIGVELVGDIVVWLRLYDLAPVTQTQVTAQLAFASRPVTRT